MKKTETMTGLLVLGMMLAGCSTAANEEQQPVKVQEQETRGSENRTTAPESSGDSEPVREAAPEPETRPQAAAQPDTAAGNEQIRPEFKAAMDEYVAFYEDYAAFMQRYRENPSDLNLLLEMTDWISRTETITDELDRLDASQEEMNAAELQYYLEATAKIYGLIAQAAG